MLPRRYPRFHHGRSFKLKEADDIIHFQDLEIDEEKIRILNPAEGVVAKAMAPRVAAGAGAAAGAATEEAGEEAAEGAGEEAKEEAAAASEVLKRKHMKPVVIIATGFTLQGF
ncbi:MAG: hypothetical protein R3D26_18050 [Cyanobacteriota/Melainabacteria group bacterium]